MIAVIIIYGKSFLTIQNKLAHKMPKQKNIYIIHSFFLKLQDNI